MINLPEEYEKEMRSLLGQSLRNIRKSMNSLSDRDCV